MIAFLSLLLGFFRRLFAKPVLPHPEEAQNPSATLENTDIEDIVQQWLKGWHVPVTSWVFWGGIEVNLASDLKVMYNGQIMKVPAATYAQQRQMDVDPQWANPGVIAHEMCHIAQTFLLDMTSFMLEYNTSTDPLLKLVKDKMQGRDSNWANSPFEMHADCYRYLGEKMPESLRKFYPFLF